MTLIPLTAAATAMALTSLGHILGIILLAVGAATAVHPDTRGWFAIGLIGTFVSAASIGIMALYVRQLTLLS